MKVGDLVKHKWGTFTGSGIVIKVHEGRQVAVDIMTPSGIQKRIWERHVKVANESR
mgnify:CR=1 FL=1